ncbi:PEGA domain-containing protein [Methanoregula sp.]|uniref:PEGA domain-containing protein n=1 Tax=Methanoregula sp. TaxID=2052170 RepID=UPI003569611A
MKRTILLASVLLLILLLPVTVSALGNITVSSSPIGATILIDNENSGTTISTPFTIQNVAVGDRVVVLQLTGYQSYTTTVSVTDGGTQTVTASLIQNPLAPTISSALSPAYGYNSSAVNNIIITGTGFSTTVPSVILAKSGETNITGTCTVSGSTQLTCSLPISGKSAGNWNVIVTNPDGQSATRSDGFEIRSSANTATLSSITPTSALTNTTVTIGNLVGTNFLSSATMRLKRTGYNDIYGTVTSLTSTTIAGTFDLTNQVPGSYQVCVINPSSDAVCGLTFTITSANTVNGTISFGSSPSGASVYLNASKIGTTPFSLYDQIPGSYFIRMQRSGYADYTSQAVVTPGNTTQVYAYLNPATTYTDTPASTPIPTFTTVQTTKKTTVKVPTPWPSATPTTASPINPLVILAAIGLGSLVILRKE